jgi:hypothetical protein
MIKVARAIALITCLGATLALAAPASASQARHRNRTIHIGSRRSSTAETFWSNHPASGQLHR